MLQNFLFIFLYKLTIISNKINFIHNKMNEIPYRESFNLFRTTFIYLIGEDDSFIKDLNLSEQCNFQLESSFFQNGMSKATNSYPYYKKLFYDSSNYKNDFSSYFNCINNKVETNSGDYQIQNFTYLRILIDDDKSLYDILTTNNGTSAYLYGLCFIDNCTKNDYKKIIRKALTILNLTNINNEAINKTNINNQNYPKIQIYTTNDHIKSKGFIKFLQYLPFIIICIHIFFVIFNSIPIYFYKLILFIFFCKSNKKSSFLYRKKKFKNNLINKNNKKNLKLLEKNKERNQSILNNISTNDNILKSLELLYNITNNFSSLIELKKQNEITNDGGLSYINGIKGISMIFYLFGAVYSALYSSLITDQDSNDFYFHLTNIFFGIFYVGIKFAPKLLLCTSGFSLFYKFLCFLDGKIDNEKEIMRQKNNSLVSGKEVIDSKNNDASGLNNSNSSFQKLKNENKENLINNTVMSNKYIFIFFGIQLHKYILYLLFICFIIFSLDWIVITFGNSGQMWLFFNQCLIKSAKNLKYFIPLLIGYKSYFISGLSPKKHNILHYYYLLFQEIIYFLITSVIIFIGYKKNLRIDLFLKIIFCILILFRIIYYFSKIGLDDKDYFGYNEYGQFYTSMLYNYSFYIIGVHFGMINYVIQKGYSLKDCLKNNKKYLNSSLTVLDATKKKNKKYLHIISIVGGILLFLNVFIQPIIIYMLKLIKSNNLKENMELYKRDFFSQIIMLIDSDIFVIAINAISLCMYLMGDNLLNNILCHSLWSIFNRFYFSYILLINPVILYFLYNTETKILFNISNCFLYSFMIGIFVYSISMVIYIIFELPFKKLIRFWFKLNENENLKERLSNVEATYSYKENDYFLDSATASITEYNEEEEDEDEY